MSAPTRPGGASDAIRALRPIRPVRTAHAPRPRGRYEQALVCGGLVFVSAQLPLQDGERELELRARPVEVQARRALANVLAIVAAAGGTTRSVLQLRFYLADVAAWEAVDAACAALLDGHRPARAVIPTGLLHLGFAVAVEAVARADGACGSEELP